VVRSAVTRGWRRFGKIMLLEYKGDFENAEIPHKMNEILEEARLPTYIDVIPNLMGDSEAPPTLRPLHFSYENADFTTTLDSISIIT
jgi:hypothetical protein